MNSNKDKFMNTEVAADILKQFYGIVGRATPLPGYVDYNFKIEVDNCPTYILKVSRTNCQKDSILFLYEILNYINSTKIEIETPIIIKNNAGQYVSELIDKGDLIQYVRLLNWIPGRVWHQVNPRLPELHHSLGVACGQITTALQGFDHDLAHRDFEWDTAQSLWTKDHSDLFEGEEHAIITYFQKRFEDQLESYNELRKSVVHNDANDYNIIVADNLINPVVKSIIDFGDAIHTQVINDVGIACAYAIMDHNDPLEAALPIIDGYHSIFPLQEAELIHLYDVIGMRLVVSLTSSTINKQKEPDNAYLQVSADRAWSLLKKWYDISSDFAHFSFRKACGFTAHPFEPKFLTWAKDHKFSINELFPTTSASKLKHIDLSVASTWLGHEEEIADLELFQFKIERLQEKYPNQVLAGGYLEPRVIYTSDAYAKNGNSGRENRTVHLGLDFWFPPHTPVHALFDGEVVTACNDAGDKEYGGLVILKHDFNNLEFYTLYGHCTVESATTHMIGDRIKKGDKIAELGDHHENGNWAPHLHFQIMFSMLDYEFDFPGVAYPNQLEVWKGLCPDPNLLFKSLDLESKTNFSINSLIGFRNKHLGKSMSLQYKQPLHIVRGSGVYLIDNLGRKYLDTVNNVAHVGHEHLEVVRAGQEQIALLNTNTRYLHKNINKLAEVLQETLPKELCVFHFVNSGSEANELALRMAKTFTGQQDIIASEVGYHGNTNACIDISSYKFDGKGGSGAPEHTQIFPLPDTFRGKYRGPEAGSKYADEVQKCIQNIHAKNRNIAAFIIEPILSCGGQIELPKGFLKSVYQSVREAGGLCISDEVQTGCGRLGKVFWGFQLHDVIPDIITIGKPLGNGHPVAAVVCTKQVAQSFANGMEYFNTFGGNPVSCVIASQVIQAVKREKLQQNALEIGNFLKSELVQLSKKFPIIGDVRGQGLFLGFELVDQNLNPLPKHTEYLINRMRTHGILMSSDGPDHNVIKIKPPIVFSKGNVHELILHLKKIFNEDFMMHY